VEELIICILEKHLFGRARECERKNEEGVSEKKIERKGETSE
jgi:hypothetical protein